MPAHPEADQEHHHEVNQQRHGNQQHVERNPHNSVALEAEHHEDGEQQRDQRDRADPWNEDLFVPRSTFGSKQHESGDHPGQERDAEIDEDALRDLPDADFDDAPGQTQERRQPVMKNQA